MKKYLVLGVTLIFLFVILFFKDSMSYAYVDCDNKVIVPYEVSTLNLESFLSEQNYNSLKKICSYDRCYEVREDTVKKTVSNFKRLYDKKLSEDEYFEVYVKGYPITEIVVDAC